MGDDFVDLTCIMVVARRGRGLNERVERHCGHAVAQWVLASNRRSCFDNKLCYAGDCCIVGGRDRTAVLAFMPLAWSTVWLLEGLRWLIALSVLLLALGLLYRFGPSRRAQRGRWFTTGAVCVVVLWIAASAGLSFYLTNFASYNEVYGSIGAVIGMLLWLYLSAYLILLGAVLNSLVHRKSAPYVAPHAT